MIFFDGRNIKFIMQTTLPRIRYDRGFIYDYALSLSNFFMQDTK